MATKEQIRADYKAGKISKEAARVEVARILEAEKASATPEPQSAATPHPLVTSAVENVGEMVGEPVSDAVGAGVDEFKAATAMIPTSVEDVTSIPGKIKKAGTGVANFLGRSAELAPDDVMTPVSELEGMGNAIGEMLAKLPPEQREAVLTKAGVTTGVGLAAAPFTGGMSLPVAVLVESAAANFGSVLGDMINEYREVSPETSAAEKAGKFVGGTLGDSLTAGLFSAATKFPEKFLEFQRRNSLSNTRQIRQGVKVSGKRALVDLFPLPETPTSRILKNRMDDGAEAFSRLAPGFDMKGKGIGHMKAKLDDYLTDPETGLFVRRKRAIEDFDNVIAEQRALGKEVPLIKQTDVDFSDFFEKQLKRKKSNFSQLDVDARQEIIENFKGAFGGDVFPDQLLNGKKVIVNNEISLQRANELLEVAYENLREAGKFDISTQARGIVDPSVQAYYGAVTEANTTIAAQLKKVINQKANAAFRQNRRAFRQRGLRENMVVELGDEIHGLMPYQQGIDALESHLGRGRRPSASGGDFGGSAAGAREGVMGAVNTIAEPVTRPMQRAGRKRAVNLESLEAAADVADTSAALNRGVVGNIAQEGISRVGDATIGASRMGGEAVGRGLPVMNAATREPEVQERPKSVEEALTNVVEETISNPIGVGGKITAESFYDRDIEEIEEMTMALQVSPETKDHLVQSANGTRTEQRTALGELFMEMGSMGFDTPSPIQGVHSFVPTAEVSDARGLGVVGYVTNTTEQEIFRQAIDEDYADDTLKRSKLKSSLNDGGRGAVLEIPPSLSYTTPIPEDEEKPKRKSPKKKSSSTISKMKKNIVEPAKGFKRVASKL